MEQISYYSTNHLAEPVSFSEALLKGLAPDRGLFMPNRVPGMDKQELESLMGKPYEEVAFFILQKYLSDEISDKELMAITKDAYNFPVPLEPVTGNRYVMRLDQGPTASFKDFAARAMGRLMQHFLQKQDREMLILTATSGDTGSAIANAFYGLDNIRVVILFPEKEVTDRQRKQMTTLQKNIQTIAIDGKFDDCQALVKKAFNDRELDGLPLSSANSINIGRLLPQSVYYMYAYTQLAKSAEEEIIFCVPSGNFGNLMGGLLAKHMGLPVKKFVVATNENDEVPEYFKTHLYKTIVPSKNCISSAMNVGHPSNMARVIELYRGVMNEKGEILKAPDLEQMQHDMYAIAISDETTRQTIKNAWQDHELLLEPHGAVGWKALNEFLENNPGTRSLELAKVSLETAHPAKFPKEIQEILGMDPELPPALKGLDEMEEAMDKLDNNYEDFKKYLQKKY
jgi:threonine synthase